MRSIGRNFILVFCLFNPLLVFAGGGMNIGNGGDLVKCHPSSENDLFGYYSLDYLVFNSESHLSPRKTKSWEESIFEIRVELAKKVPELLTSFDHFSEEILNTDYSKLHVWEPTSYELIEIDDEELPVAVRIPDNCRKNQKVQLVQAVIRQNLEFSGGKNIIFKYMPETFSSLKNQGPLQLSFLLVHEWLWSVSDNVDRNRRINWYLHSEAFVSDNKDDARATLKAMGLDLKELPIKVSKDGTGHYKSLARAIELAPEGATIHIYPGLYYAGNGIIDRPLTILGVGALGEVVIRGNLSQPVLQINEFSGEKIIFENITFDGVDNENGPRGFREFAWLQRYNSSMIKITHGNLYVKNCRFGLTKDPGFAVSRAAISVIGENSFLHISGNEFFRTWYSIVFADLSRGHIEENKYYGYVLDDKKVSHIELEIPHDKPDFTRDQFTFENESPLRITLNSNTGDHFCAPEERLDSYTCEIR